MVSPRFPPALCGRAGGGRAPAKTLTLAQLEARAEDPTVALKQLLKDKKCARSTPAHVRPCLSCHPLAIKAHLQLSVEQA